MTADRQTRTAHARPVGRLGLRHITALQRPVVRTVADALRHGTAPRLAVGRRARWQRANRENFERSLHDMGLREAGRLPFVGHLWGRVLRADGTADDLGLMSCRVVTDAGAGFLVDAIQNLVEAELLRFHGLGTGTTAEAATQTALAAELTTQYATASTRPTGTLGEKTGDPKTFETTATITVSAAAAVTEHGIFSQAAVPGGVMLDRSVFAVVNLAATESLQVTYSLGLPSGG